MSSNVHSPERWVIREQEPEVRCFNRIKLPVNKQALGYFSMTVGCHGGGGGGQVVVREGRLKIFYTTGPSFSAILLFDKSCGGSRLKTNGSKR